MKLIAASLLLLLSTQAAHAGLYEERQEVAYARARAERQQSEAAALTQAAAAYGAQLRAFIAKLGGAAAGDCGGYAYECYNGSCGQGAKVTIPVASVGAGPYYMAGCSVTLNDGQACVINEYFNTANFTKDGMIAYCYDAASVRHVYYSKAGRAAKKPARRKR